MRELGSGHAFLCRNVPRIGPARVMLALLVGLALGSGAGAQAIVADHRSTALEAVPAEWLELARESLRVGYSHTSHGSQLVTGIEALHADLGDDLDYSSSGWGLEPGVFLNDYWASDHAADLGSGGDLGWRDATVTMLELPDNDRNVVMWSWCGGVSSASEDDIDAYLEAMDGLEQTYPDVVFVYMTGHLDGSGTAGNLHLRNQQIRTYCRTHGKVLFDFADIESFDPDGLTDYGALYATDGCEYDANGDGNPWGDGNWAAEWVAANPSSALARQAAQCGDCAHSEPLNCVLKGRAFWWLMARLAGWDGASGTPTVSYLIPAVAHAPGVGSAVWRSDVSGANASADSATLSLSFTDVDTGATVTRGATLGAGDAVEWADILVGLFDLPASASARGVVRVDSTAALALVARTYSQAADLSTFGQSLPALTEDDAIAPGALGYLPGLKENQRFRSNLGLVNISDAAAQVRIRLYAVGGGEVGGAATRTVAGHGWLQIDRVLQTLGAGQLDLAYATLEVLSSGTRVWAYASVVDNQSQDPTTIPVVVP